nr:immunoglobulin heavy chain junction region [Macaca mulatta]MOW89075.1 immunoglobulin heavy chain junction region [Macaca mulatta]MOW92637.1 immunoglobulin heavy chain junction region [Macaca mulatta]MOW92755.1 immunoglobulin heavy chain junction region [Macaca mulatta]MOW92898.1 immunoglobulin heavy chain junction region [Macaca mulatta]
CARFRWFHIDNRFDVW